VPWKLGSGRNPHILQLPHYASADAGKSTTVKAAMECKWRHRIINRARFPQVALTGKARDAVPPISNSRCGVGSHPPPWTRNSGIPPRRKPFHFSPCRALESGRTSLNDGDVHRSATKVARSTSRSARSYGRIAPLEARNSSVCQRSRPSNSPTSQRPRTLPIAHGREWGRPEPLGHFPRGGA
jgi:hypothetical protein